MVFGTIAQKNQNQLASISAHLNDFANPFLSPRFSCCVCIFLTLASSNLNMYLTHSPSLD